MFDGTTIEGLVSTLKMKSAKNRLKFTPPDAHFVRAV